MTLKLTSENPEVAEILVILAEECSELSIECSKGIRFGVSGHTRDRLNTEAGDVIALIGILLDREILDEETLVNAIGAKINKLRDWSSIKL